MSAVELSFRFPAFEVAGEPITLCGHLDKLVDIDNQRWVVDHKTTKGALSASYFAQYSPHNQFSLYTIAGKVILGTPAQGVICSAAQIGVTFSRFALRMIPRAQAVLTEWLDDAKWWISRAREFALTDHWPMNDKSCGNYGGCAFAKVCAVSPTHRIEWLKQDFAEWAWNPLDTRGDV